MSTTLDTILWLNKEIDKINAEATVIGDMLLEETSIELVQILDKRLQDLETKMGYLQTKINFEKNQVKNN